MRVVTREQPYAVSVKSAQWKLPTPCTLSAERPLLPGTLFPSKAFPGFAAPEAADAPGMAPAPGIEDATPVVEAAVFSALETVVPVVAAAEPVVAAADPVVAPAEPAVGGTVVGDFIGAAVDFAVGVGCAGVVVFAAGCAAGCCAAGFGLAGGGGGVLAGGVVVWVGVVVWAKH